MRLFPEDLLLDILRRTIALSAEILPLLSGDGAAPIHAPIREKYSALLADIHGQKRNESILSDESWEWIWEVREDLNGFQMYGRLAWLNYNLFDLL
jgi:hypothetical protein